MATASAPNAKAFSLTACAVSFMVSCFQLLPHSAAQPVCRFSHRSQQRVARAFLRTGFRLPTPHLPLLPQIVARQPALPSNIQMTVGQGHLLRAALEIETCLKTAEFVIPLRGRLDQHQIPVGC